MRPIGKRFLPCFSSMGHTNTFTNVLLLPILSRSADKEEPGCKLPGWGGTLTIVSGFTTAARVTAGCDSHQAAYSHCHSALAAHVTLRVPNRDLQVLLLQLVVRFYVW